MSWRILLFLHGMDSRAEEATDITEVECTPDLNEKLPATSSKLNILK